PMQLIPSGPPVQLPAPLGYTPAFGNEAVVPAVNPVTQYLAIILRYWWIIVLGAIAGAAYQYRKTRGDIPIYITSTAVRFIDQRPVGVSGVPDMGMGCGGGGTDPVLTQIQVIKSRLVAERVVDSLGLQLRSITPGYLMRDIIKIVVSRQAVADTKLNLEFS